MLVLLMNLVIKSLETTRSLVDPAMNLPRNQRRSCSCLLIFAFPPRTIWGHRQSTPFTWSSLIAQTSSEAWGLGSHCSPMFLCLLTMQPPSHVTPHATGLSSLTDIVPHIHKTSKTPKVSSHLTSVCKTAHPLGLPNPNT